MTVSLGEWPIPAKIALDQTIYLGFYNTIYCVSLGFLGGKSAREVADEVDISISIDIDIDIDI